MIVDEQRGIKVQINSSAKAAMQADRVVKKLQGMLAVKDWGIEYRFGTSCCNFTNQ